MNFSDALHPAADRQPALLSVGLFLVGCVAYAYQLLPVASTAPRSTFPAIRSVSASRPGADPATMAATRWRRRWSGGIGEISGLNEHDLDERASARR